MVRRLTPIWVLLLVASACGGDLTTTTEPVTEERLPQVIPVTDAVPISVPANGVTGGKSTGIEHANLYEGFGTLNATTSTLVVLARGDIPVFHSPNDQQSFMTLPWTTIMGTATVLTAVSDPGDGWLEVMLPIRPNGSTGFVRTEGLDIYTVGGRIIVDLSERQLTYEVDGNEVLSTTVAVGASSNPTPTGEFFVTDSVTVTGGSGPWGPYALGLSARSDTITEYNGGDGIIGIHGTNQPSSIGEAASLGCVRLPNEMISLLHGMVPIGTPVDIRA